MHEPVTVEHLWFFLIGGLILCVFLFLLLPKLITFLDRWIDDKYQEEKKISDEKKNKSKH